MGDREKVDVDVDAEVEYEEQHAPAKGLINQEKAEHAVNEPGKLSVKFQLYATGVIILTALTGGILGVILSNNEVDEDVVSWIGLPGDLFIRALRCVVLPLVFVNVILAVIQMVEAGKAGAVGKWTVLIYTLTTMIASMEGLIAVAIFQNKFTSEDEDPKKTFVNIACPSGGLLFQSGSDVICVEDDNSSINFEIINENGFFETTGEDFNVFSFSETLQTGIFEKLVPDNIVAEFANGGFVGVVMFGILFGAASQKLHRKPTLLIDFLQDVNDCMVRIIEWIIYLTPIAVFSLIAGALAAQENLLETFRNIGFLVLASVLAIGMHLIIVYPTIFFLITKTNPYKYMRYIIPAQIFAFSCASSAATLPVTLRCVKETGQVPDSIRDFVLPIGATINMDGTALYFPPALIFLAKTAGLEVEASAYFLIVLVSTLGSAGAAPVPNAGLVLIITAFNTVFNSTGTPQNFAIIVGIDWLMDRFQTALNITGDAMVSRIVTHLSGSNIREGEPTSELAIEESV